mmetsp:Transcript_19669/g.75535  ORF Transcript_19669/g.75535 Transcript_19669/m.75535 type:complete len:234 (+) Transcript_19669:1095-1796(+)
MDQGALSLRLQVVAAPPALGAGCGHNGTGAQSPRARGPGGGPRRSTGSDRCCSEVWRTRPDRPWESRGIWGRGAWGPSAARQPQGRCGCSVLESCSRSRERAGHGGAQRRGRLHGRRRRVRRPQHNGRCRGVGTRGSAPPRPSRGRPAAARDGSAAGGPRQRPRLLSRRHRPLLWSRCLQRHDSQPQRGGPHSPRLAAWGRCPFPSRWQACRSSGCSRSSPRESGSGGKLALV